MPNPNKQVEVIGNLRGANLKTKVDENEREVCTLEVKVTLLEGQSEFDKVREKLGSPVKIMIDPVQLKLN